MMRNTGIALVVTLLVAVVLFIAILAVSSSLGLSSRRATADRRVSLEAQYAAESGLALAKTQLAKLGEEAADFLKADSGFELPADTDWIDLRPYVIKFCGATSADIPATHPSATTVLCSPDPADAPVFLSTSTDNWVEEWAEIWRDPAPWSTPGNSPYAVFLDHIDPAKYPPGVSPADYWKAHIGPQTQTRIIKTSGGIDTVYTVTYGFAPYRAEMLADGSLRFSYRALPVIAKGELKKDGRVLGVRKLQQDYSGELQVDMRPPSFAHFMLFTNFQRAGSAEDSARVFFYDGTMFNGPVHTNEHFNFTGNPWFGDAVTSAGCTDDSYINAEGNKDCKPGKDVEGFYYWDSISNDAKFTPPVNPIPAYMNTDPEFTVAPEWDSDYIPLPKSSDDQYLAAKSGGLFLRDDDASNAPGLVDIQVVTLSTKTVGGIKYQFLQVSYRAYGGIIDPPPTCVPDPTPPPPPPPPPPGDGSPPPSPPPPPGPDVRMPTLPYLAAAIYSGAKLGAPHPLRMALEFAIKQGNLVQTAMAITCPPGTHPVDPPPYIATTKGTYAYRIDPTGKVERNDGSGWTYVQSGFNGVIYVGKEVTGSSGTVTGETSSFLLNAAGRAEPNLSKWAWWTLNNPRTSGTCAYTSTPEGKCVQPSIADFSKLTLVGNNIKITRDLTYEERPCTSAPERNPDGSVTPASCSNLSAQNVLGIYSDRGSIAVSQFAPKNMFIDAVLMAAQKSVYYEGWKTKPPRGYLHLTGGIIQNWYGRFGRLNPDLSIKNGYGRKFTYDPRMKKGLQPPFFPKFDGDLPWTVDANVVNGVGGSGTGLWKPVEGN